MRVLLVSGIWPPDVGGPATHAPELAAWLTERGHQVEVVTTARSQPAPEPYRVVAVPRSLPLPLRHAAVVARIAARSRDADVVYATSMVERTALALAPSRTPLAVKLAGDVAYERARRRGLFDGDLGAFQRTRGGLVVRGLKAARTLALRRAARVVCPSGYVRSLALGWGLLPERVTVVPNAAPPAPELPPAEELRRAHGFDGPTLVFAGRLTAAKALDVALAALARTDRVGLAVVGDGEERAPLELRARELGLNGRVRFLGAQERRAVLELYHAADAALLSSSTENFPHVLVEALAVGTPVVATAVGGVPEIVDDGENGLLVPPGDPAALAAAIERLTGDDELRGRLAAGARASAGRFAPERVYAQLESVLIAAAGA